MKKPESKVDADKLRMIIRKWGLSQKVLARESSISYSQFKLKLNEKQKYYSFSQEEYISVLKAISNMVVSVLEFKHKEELKLINNNISPK